MSQDQNQSQHIPGKPWRFKGVKGVVLVHPEARVLAISPDTVYDKGEDPPRKIAAGCLILMEVPGRAGENAAVTTHLIVFDTGAEIEQQIIERGGWR